MATVKITIDGQPLDVEAGKTIIQAAHEAGIKIPYYCYHPGLIVDGNCRICLVEVEKMPKLVVACKTPVTDGMVIRSGNERVEQARRGVMEFLLINHPIDCPVCDQAGECKLQDYYYDYDLMDSRMRERKQHKPKVVDFGEHVKFDGERCILCSRCVRFTRDVSESHELSIFNRGDRSVIGLTPGATLDNDYSLNTVDICPVGALTSRDFRFQKRVWFLDEVDSVCPGCSRGCATKLDVSRREDKAYRARPRKNLLVNQYWMCDYGRAMTQLIERNRMTEHRIDGAAATRDSAVAAAADRLRAAGNVGVLLSRHMSNEELAALKELLARLPQTLVALGDDRVAEAGETARDNFLIEPDKNPNARGAREAFGLDASHDNVPALRAALADGKIDVLLVCGFTARRVLGDLAARAGAVVRLAAHQDDLGVVPAVELAGRVWAEKDGSFTNVDGVVTAFTAALQGPAGAADDLAIIAALGAALGAEVPGDVEAAWALLAAQNPLLSGVTFAALCERTALAPGQSVEAV